MFRNRNAKNIVFGFLSQVIILTLGLIIPRIILTHYNSDINGLTSTITQIFLYISLLEAGIGQATINALYPYINGEIKEKEKISEVMAISRSYYRKVTALYAIVVVAMALILPLILKTSVSYSTIFFIVLFEGMTGVVTFWAIQNWTMLLIADGKNYVKLNIELVNRVICYGIKITLALNSVNIALIQLGFFAVSIFKLGIYKRYMNKHYPWIDYKVKNADTLKLKDRNSYLITEVAWTIFSSTDMIVLSIFCSTQLASVYFIYNMVFVALNGLLDSVYTGIRFNLGQSYHTNFDRYKNMHDLFNSVFMGMMTATMCVTYIMIIPFVRLYTDGITDINYIISELPIMFCLIQLISWSRYIAGNLSGLAGYAKQTSYLSLIEGLINVISSIVLVQYWGIVGLLMATVISLPIKSIYLNWISENKIMCRKPYKTILIVAVNFLCFFIVVFISNQINVDVRSYGSFVLHGIVFTILSIIFVMSANMMVNRNLSKFMMDTVNAIKSKLIYDCESRC